MANIHDKEDLSNDYQNNGSQITKHMPKKYTFLAEIKILQDRMQDMFSNRSDMVNATGDGFAAAHQNEIKEIFWVYMNSLGWVSGLHGAIIGTILGMLGFIYAGALLQLSLIYPAFVLFFFSTLCVAAPFGYVVYAEMITEDTGKFVVGASTKAFHTEMKKAMAFIVSNTIMITMAVFVAMLFIVGIFDTKLILLLHWILKIIFRIQLDSTSIETSVFSNGSIYGMISFGGVMVLIFLIRKFVIDDIKHRTTKLSAAHKKMQKQFKNKDSVQEAKELFK